MKLLKLLLLATGLVVSITNVTQAMKEHAQQEEQAAPNLQVLLSTIQQTITAAPAGTDLNGLDTFIQQFKSNTLPDTHSFGDFDDVAEKLGITLTWDSFKNLVSTQCSVCLIKALPTTMGETICKHSIHDACLTQWLKNHNTCPLCRANIITGAPQPAPAAAGAAAVPPVGRFTNIVNQLDINLSISDVTDTELAGIIQRNPNLQTLCLNSCQNITDAGLAHLTRLITLQTLNLSGCRNITDAGLEHLTRLITLQTLNLSFSNITDSGLAPLTGLITLQTLNLSFSNITDAGLAHLTRLITLQTLNLSGCRNITDAGLAHLTGLITLQTLNLSSCQNITNAGLTHLARLTKLQILDLLNCQNITDAGLAHLTGLTNLQTLDLYACEKITDTGLAHLAGLRNLQRLNLSSCQNITNAGRQALRNSLPNIRIY